MNAFCLGHPLRKRRPGIEVQRRRLLDAARRLFAERGVEGISIVDIVEASGVSRQTFYRCFATRDALLSQVFDELEDHVTTRLTTALIGASPNGDWLFGFVHEVLSDAALMGGLLVALHREELRPGSPMALRRHRRLQRHVTFVERACESAGVVPPSPDVTRSLVLLLQVWGLEVATDPQVRSRVADLSQTLAGMFRQTLVAVGTLRDEPERP
ncbi:MAG: TetR/AcrR family transcriptional regulator [Myxococcota bacterium]